ncbi:VOC family protein [Kitasatospora sp. McL0602]|uniref:VOC family protein n=1 Tax=Kitasatospora sp. McL0602 TaxID=3439530 RepID=UPI003F8BBAFD
MDALHPRLLVGRYADAFRFYDAVLPELIGATRTRGSADGPYASWDVGAEGVLAIFDRAVSAAALGLAEGGSGGGLDRAMFVSRVEDVDRGYELCLRHGGEAVAAPADRPEWGPGMRTAHLRDPDGNLLELQSY